MTKNVMEVKVDHENGDYRELEATFTMTRNTSYSDTNKNLKDTADLNC